MWGSLVAWSALRSMTCAVPPSRGWLWSAAPRQRSRPSRDTACAACGRSSTPATYTEIRSWCGLQFTSRNGVRETRSGDQNWNKFSKMVWLFYRRRGKKRCNFIGGRTRTRTLDPLIKRRVISSEDQRPFRQMVDPGCIGHTIDFSFVGMMRLSQRRYEGTSILARCKSPQRGVLQVIGSGFKSEVRYIACTHFEDAVFCYLRPAA